MPTTGHLAVFVRNLDGVDRIYQPEFLTLADHDPIRKAETPGM